MFLMASRSRSLVSLTSGFALISENASVPKPESILCVWARDLTLVEPPEGCIFCM